MLPWTTSLDVEYVGQHSYRTLEGVDINAVDFGAAFLPHNQDPTLAARRRRRAQRRCRSDLMRAFRGYAGITQQLGRGSADVPLAPGVVQAPLQQRRLVRVQRHDRALRPPDSPARASSTPPTAPGPYRADQAKADELLGNNNPVAHTMKANFVWDLPDLKSRQSALHAIGSSSTTGSSSGIWTAATGGRVHRRLQLPEQRRQRQPDRAARTTARASASSAIRARAAAATSTGSSTRRRSRARAYGSVGLESGNDYLRGLLLERARSGDRPEHPARRRPEHPAARRHVQRAERGRHHGAQHDDEPDQPGGSHDDHATCRSTRTAT